MLKKKTAALRVLCAALGISLTVGMINVPYAAAEEATDVTLTAEADTTVQSWKHQKAWNNGALDVLRIRYTAKQTDNTFYHDPTVTDEKNTTDAKIGYTRFKLTGLDHGIKSAALRVSGAADITDSKLDVYKTGSDWIEGTVTDTAVAADGSEGMTWYSRPDVGDIIGTISGGAANEYVETDVTDYVKDADSQAVSFALLSNEENGSETKDEFKLHSRESSYPPQLVITPYTDEEIAAAGDETKAEIDLAALDIETVYENAKYGDIIDLPDVTAYGGSTIEWTSSDTETVSDDGEILKDVGEEATVTMTAAFADKTKKFNITLRGENYNEASVAVSSEKGADIDGRMFGLFFEDINYAADGGIMAEMVENYSFEFFNGDGDQFDYGWSATGDGASFEVTDEYPLNDNNTHCAKITVTDPTDGVANKAYDGIYMSADGSYNVSLYARSEIPVTVSAGKDGTVYGTVTLEKDENKAECAADGWEKYSGVLTVSEDIDGGELVIGLESAGEAYIDMVSAVSADAVMGLFRKDIAERLSQMQPGFVRFPGGCAVEGGATLDTAYNWKNTVGEREQRRLNKSRWQTGDSKYYCQSYNLGFYEYFLLCEYLGADPVPVVNAGLACMTYKEEEKVPVYNDSTLTYETASESDLTDEFMTYVNDILDLIDFANSTDFDNNEWAALRRSMGHEEPFNLKKIGIGNEQWQRGENQWRDRYYWIEHFVHKKDDTMQLMSSAAWYHTGNSVHDGEYRFVSEQLKNNPDFTYAVDEHYYETPDWFYGNMNYYDEYSRDVNVFLGEVSARWAKKAGDETICTLENAIAEAAYFTMVERNSDIVKMVSAAPLLCRTGGTKYSQWSPNLIWFDGKKNYAAPSFYVQTMYGQNTGDYSYRSSVTGSDIYENTTYDEESGDLIIKVVNSSDEAQTVSFAIDEGISLTSDNAKVITLSGDKADCNTIENSENIAPETTYARGLGHSFTRELAANSFTIIRIGKSGDEDLTEPDTTKYMMVHFVEPAKSGETVPNGNNYDGEQIYFSVSEDGNTWKMLNNMDPVLRSALGTTGVRDPYIIRSPKDGKFYIIATDLSHTITNNWGNEQRKGSKSIMVWESDDLVNWSDERMCRVATDTSGCAWAPECVWDEERETFMVFWSSLTSETSYKRQVVYRSFTDDFKTFTDPEVYIENDHSTIDVSIKKIGDRYYRISKNEESDAKYVYFEVSQSDAEVQYPLDGTWTPIENDKLKAVTQNGSWEGALFYKVNGTENTWRAMVDHYNKPWTDEFPESTKGLTQFETTDIANADFYSINDKLVLPQYTDRQGTINGSGRVVYKHGTVLPITDEEYDNLVSKYGISGAADASESPAPTQTPTATPAPTASPAAATGLDNFSLLERDGWSAETNSAQSASGNNSVGMVLDGDTDTIWHSSWTNAANYDADTNPVYLTIDMGSSKNVSAIRYTPRRKTDASGSLNGVITAYEIYVSDDNVTWKKAGEGDMGYTKDDAVREAKDIIFSPVGCRYIKLVAKGNLNNTPLYVASCAEFDAYTYTGADEEHPIVSEKQKLDAAANRLEAITSEHSVKAKLLEKVQGLKQYGTVDGIEGFLSAAELIVEALEQMENGVDDVYISRLMDEVSDADVSAESITNVSAALSAFGETGAQAKEKYAPLWQDEFTISEEELSQTLYERIAGAIERARSVIDSGDGTDYIMLKELVSYLSAKNAYDGFGNNYGRSAEECEAIVSNINFTLSNLEKIKNGTLATELAEYRSGEIWLDTLGSKISAHGGQIIKSGDTYYWYGEDNKISYDLTTGVSCYSSRDLKNWKYEGLAFKAFDDGTEEKKFTQEFMSDTITGSEGRIERPKVVYNAKNDNYVMWMHLEKDGGYGLSVAGVAVSDSPTGPFEWKWYGRPVADSYVQVKETLFQAFRDMNLFVDDDNTAYVFYSSENNKTMYAVRLNDDYTWIDDSGLESSGTDESAISQGCVITPDMTEITTADFTYGKTSFTRYQLASGGGMQVTEKKDDDGNTVKDENGKIVYVSQRNDKLLAVPTYADGRWARVGQNIGEGNELITTGETIVKNDCFGNREAPAPFKKGGRYYLITSALSGWKANPSLTEVSDNILGKWFGTGNPATGEGPQNDGSWSSEADSSTTFNSQSTCVLQLPDGSYMYMADRWKNGAYLTDGNENVKASTYVWLPITFETDKTYGDGTARLRWHDGWTYSAPTVTAQVTDGRITALKVDSAEVSEAAPATIYVAQYDDLGTLIDVKAVTVTSTDAVDTDIEIKGNVKLMLWDAELTPLCGQGTFTYGGVSDNGA